ncbi:hypothetical protein J7E86_20585 [Streptomyces sp. ISL-11]|nr:hypothetical protein [Streptomyces sp. ISL-11]
MRAVTIATCLPYLSLKLAWTAGNRTGIPEGSVLLDHETFMRWANGVTLLMDAGVVVLALLLTRPWGRRLPAWPPALTMWGAAGLLAPIVYGFPAQLAVRALGGTAADPAPDGRPLLDEWVFGVVYGGFIVQGLGLGALFALYARGRWGHLWRGRVADLAACPPGRGQRTAAAVAAVLALMPAAVHLLWAAGSPAGLAPDLARSYSGDFAAGQSGHALFALATTASLALLVLGRGGRLPLSVPLVLAGLGSAATACWGGWPLLAALAGPDRSGTPLMITTYAVQMITGTLVLAVGARFFAQRAARLRAA